MKHLNEKIIIVFVIIFAISINIVYSEPYVGCPIGLLENDFWIKTQWSYSEATKKYDINSDKLKSLPKDTYNKKHKGFLRIGYGLYENFDIGLLLTYVWPDMQASSIDPFGNTIVVKKKDYDGMDDPWISAKYKFLEVEKASFIEHFQASFGFAYKIKTTSDWSILNSIGNGAPGAKLSFLSHFGVGFLEFCNHLTYEWNGQAKEVSPLNQDRTNSDNANAFYSYPFSNQDIADRLNYKFFIEFEFLEYFAYSGGLNGFLEIQEVVVSDDFKGSYAFEGKKRYMHKITNSIEIAVDKIFDIPYHHRKLKLTVGIPYKVYNNFAPDYVLSTAFMWVFDVE